MVDFGPDGEDPTWQVEEADNVYNLDAACSLLILVAKAAAPSRHVNVLVLFVLSGNLLEA